MPELPEVEVVVKELNKIAINKFIKNILISNSKMIKRNTPNEFLNLLKGTKIEWVERRGKFIIFHTDSSMSIVSHMRMEGKYFYYKNHEEKSKHTHIIFVYSDGSELHYNDTRQFGVFELIDTKTYLLEKPLLFLAPEPKDASVDEILKKTSKKRISIKATLLDQSIISGIGNIYVNEILWFAKINPHTPTHLINKKQWNLIIDIAIKMFEKSISMGGSSIQSYTSLNGVQGTYQNELKVHMREGSNCSRCNEVILKEKVAQRGTYYCIVCQPKKF